MYVYLIPFLPPLNNSGQNTGRESITGSSELVISIRVYFICVCVFLVIVATEQSLDVVSDLLGNFLERLSTVLKKNLESEQMICDTENDLSMDVSCLQ